MMMMMMMIQSRLAYKGYLVPSISWLTIMTDFRGFYQLFYRNANVTPSNMPEIPPSKSLLSQYS
jgi:hypothetical protein